MSEQSTDSPRAVIHVIRKGRAVCGFAAHTAARWPPGHLWVSTEDAVRATCTECVRRVLD